jgi:thioredoxin reductase
LATRNIPIRSERLARIDSTGDALRELVFDQGPPLPRSALFLHPSTRQRSSLPAQLGCTLLDDSSVSVDDLGKTDVPGVYAVGDMARRPTMPFPGAQVVIAAAEGAVAALAIDQELVFEDLN